MFDSLFGLPLAARFFIAFVVVLALIGVTAWVVRRFGAARLGGGSARGRQPRLAVIDAASIDGRRRLVLIRRDNIEHLLMIGGPSDVVIEPNIVRAGTPREAGRIDAPPRDSARATPALENGWPLQPLSEPAPAPPAVPAATTAPAARAAFRAAAAEEPWTAPEPGARARPAENLSGLAAELSSRLAASELPPQALAPRPDPVISRPEPTAPAPRVTVMPPPPEAIAEPAATQDQNLADMAHQLEAALRRAPDNRPPATDPLAQARPGEVRAALREPKARGEPSLDVKPEPRVEPKLDVKPEPLFEPKFKPDTNVARLEPKLDIKPEPKPQAPAKGQDFYDNLEEEMASLLGRPSGKS